MTPIDKNEVLCSITWTVEDLYKALDHAGYEPSDENVARLLQSKHQLSKNLKDLSIQKGWEILDTLITCSDVKLD